jgi:hypothetical protein
MTKAGDNKKRRSGQAIIFFIMAMVILAFVVLSNYDLHRILYVKSLSENAGDSAAIAAARWQGITLNLIGDLNLMHAVALSVNNTNKANEVTAIQARLCYVGPMIGFMAAQQAAKQNRMYNNDEFYNIVKSHASVVAGYAEPGPDGQMLFQEPYLGCWKEYAAMLSLIAADGIAAGPDNASLYTDYSGSHILLDMGFYNAVASSDWCWFHNNEPTLLQDYENFFPCWWPPLPPLPKIQYINSEYFGLGLSKQTTTLFQGGYSDFNTMSGLALERLGSNLKNTNLDSSATWYCYDTGKWTAWQAFSPTNANPFPAVGTVKQQYNYAGADAVVRIEAEQISLLTPDQGGSKSQRTVVWTAAAKPFGYLNASDTPQSQKLVLPAFHDVRLIPIDASSAPSGGSFNLAWQEHIENHLPVYMADGPAACDKQFHTCRYCQQLVTWENTAFRRSGIEWLSENSWQCTESVGGGGGGGGSGGTSTGH